VIRISGFGVLGYWEITVIRGKSCDFGAQQFDFWEAITDSEMRLPTDLGGEHRYIL
jgi:hypothetical protein